MRTPEEIAAKILAENGSNWAERNVEAALAQAAREALSIGYASAKAGDWELSNVSDESGKWVFVQVYDPDAESESDEDEQVLAATISMSDIEALTLYRHLGSQIAHLSPNLLPEYDTVSSASREHFAATDRYMLRDDMGIQLVRKTAPGISSQAGLASYRPYLITPPRTKETQ